MISFTVEQVESLVGEFYKITAHNGPDLNAHAVFSNDGLHPEKLQLILNSLMEELAKRGAK